MCLTLFGRLNWDLKTHTHTNKTRNLKQDEVIKKKKLRAGQIYQMQNLTKSHCGEHMHSSLLGQ